MRETIPARASCRSQHTNGAGWLASGFDAADRDVTRRGCTNFTEQYSSFRRRRDHPDFRRPSEIGDAFNAANSRVTIHYAQPPLTEMAMTGNNGQSGKKGGAGASAPRRLLAAKIARGYLQAFLNVTGRGRASSKETQVSTRAHGIACAPVAPAT